MTARLKYRARLQTPAEVRLLRKGIVTGMGCWLAEVRWDSLKVDGGPTGYQRDCSNGGVNKIVIAFMWAAFRLLVVAERKDGSGLYLIDGQHRKHVLAELTARGEAVPEYVAVMVIPETTRAQEALLYTFMNSALPVNGNPRFKSMILAGEEEHVRINVAVETAGFGLDYITGRATDANCTPNGIHGAGKLLVASKRYGLDILADALKLLRTAFAKGGSAKANNVPLSHRKGEYILAICHALYIMPQLRENLGSTAAAIRDANIDLDYGMVDCATEALRPTDGCKVCPYGKQSIVRCVELGKWLVKRLGVMIPLDKAA